MSLTRRGGREGAEPGRAAGRPCPPPPPQNQNPVSRLRLGGQREGLGGLLSGLTFFSSLPPLPRSGSLILDFPAEKHPIAFLGTCPHPPLKRSGKQACVKD